MKKRNRLRDVADKQRLNLAGVNVTMREAALLGIKSTIETERPHVNLRYYWPDHECLSSWDANSLKAFSAFCRKLCQSKWTDIYKSAGSSGHKTGFGYTPHKDIRVLPSNPELASFSPDLTWFELRVGQESRVHGFRAQDSFFLVFLDNQHKIYPS